MNSEKELVILNVIPRGDHTSHIAIQLIDQMYTSYLECPYLKIFRMELNVTRTVAAAVMADETLHEFENLAIIASEVPIVPGTPGQ